MCVPARCVRSIDAGNTFWGGSALLAGVMLCKRGSSGRLDMFDTTDQRPTGRDVQRCSQQREVGNEGYDGSVG